MSDALKELISRVKQKKLDLRCAVTYPAVSITLSDGRTIDLPAVFAYGELTQRQIITIKDFREDQPLTANFYSATKSTSPTAGSRVAYLLHLPDNSPVITVVRKIRATDSAARELVIAVNYNNFTTPLLTAIIPAPHRRAAPNPPKALPSYDNNGASTISDNQFILTDNHLQAGVPFEYSEPIALISKDELQITFNGANPITDVIDFTIEWQEISTLHSLT